jgi:hypothetical protein
MTKYNWQYKKRKLVTENIYKTNNIAIHRIQKKHRAIVRKITRKQRRLDWDKFVKTLERYITGTQRRGFKVFKQLQLQEKGKIKIDPITKTEWNEYCRKLWNEHGNKGEEGTEKERSSEWTDDNEDMTKIEELN